MSKGNGLDAGKWAIDLNAHRLMTWLFAHQGDVSVYVWDYVSLYVCFLGIGGGGGEGGAGHISAW